MQRQFVSLTLAYIAALQLRSCCGQTVELLNNTGERCADTKGCAEVDALSECTAATSSLGAVGEPVPVASSAFGGEGCFVRKLDGGGTTGIRSAAHGFDLAACVASGVCTNSGPAVRCDGDNGSGSRFPCAARDQPHCYGHGVDGANWGRC